MNAEGFQEQPPLSLVQNLPRLQDIYQENLTLKVPFDHAAQAFAADEGTVLLLSGSDLDSARYHILAVCPWLGIKSRYEDVSLNFRGQEKKLKQNPFSALSEILEQFSIPDGTCRTDRNYPVLSGLFGYFSYDLKDLIERLPCTCMDSGLPDLCLYAPSIILVQNKKTDMTRLFLPLLSDELEHKNREEIAAERKRYLFQRLGQKIEQGSFCIDSSGFTSSFTKKEYMASVRKIIRHLKAGDIYQANLSQRFESGFKGDAFALFQDLFRRNPAPFFSYINAGDHTIVSTSPERFIRQDDRYIETRPIKGTIARGATRDQDEKNRDALFSSLKDDAELTMIVDLMRNDLSRAAEHGSVKVKEHKRIEPYENVYHLVSIVTGELEKGKTGVDLLKAAFPGGSITGCPKIRSMEIIDDLEPVKRHVYTGSIGYISFHDTMDLSIAIRTATVFKGKVIFSVGGGIVYDSDPEKEFQETLDKGRTLMDSLSGSLGKTAALKNSRPKAWVNGKIIDQEDAHVSALSPGFQYGAGLFETLRVEKGNVFSLKEHISRLYDSWKKLFLSPLPYISWQKIIERVIDENRLDNKSAAVKIVVSRESLADDGRLFMGVFARPYVHRLELLAKDGLDLITYPNSRQSHLADHKTCNYLFYERAGRFAKDNGRDEALILNPDMTVSETSSANIFAVDGNTVIVPESINVLGGITLKSILTILSDNGYDILKKSLSRGELYDLPGVMISNSLMGAVKVLSVDSRKIEHESGLCSMINRQLFKIQALSLKSSGG